MVFGEILGRLCTGMQTEGERPAIRMNKGNCKTIKYKSDFNAKTAKIFDREVKGS